MKRANYKVVDENSTSVTIVDLGPWDRFPTVTNAAESVVSELESYLAGRKLFYQDSDGVRDEIVVKAGKFDGFRFGAERTLK